MVFIRKTIWEPLNCGLFLDNIDMRPRLHENSHEFFFLNNEKI